MAKSQKRTTLILASDDPINIDENTTMRFNVPPSDL